MDNTKSANLNVMIDSVRKVGGVIRRDFGEVANLQVASKGLNDFVTSTDIKVQKTIVEYLKEKKERFGIIAEEQDLKLIGSDIAHSFILDPIDGTTNFMHGFPYFCVSLGLVEQSKPIAGVIFNPITDELFYSEKGNGAFVDHPYKSKRLRVSKRKTMQAGLISFYMGSGDRYSEHAINVRNKLENQTAVHRNGAVALDLAYLASGNLDGVISYKPKIMDITAGISIVLEAGGVVEQLENGFFIACCSHEMMEKLKQICLG